MTELEKGIKYDAIYKVDNLLNSNRNNNSTNKILQISELYY